MQELLKRALEWLKNLKASSFAMAYLVYNHMKARLRHKDIEIQNLKLEAEYKANAEKVRLDNKDKSSDDIIDDAISKGGEIKHKPPSNS